MAQWINWGDGHDGSPNSISGTVNTYAAMTATSGDPTVTTALSVSTGDQVLLHQTKHASAAGTWEIVKVASTGSGTFEATGNLVNSYSTGAQAVLIPQYTGGTISGTVTGTAWNGTVGGIIALISSGDLVITGTITPPNGFRGGAHGVRSGNSSPTGTQGEGNTGTGSSSKSANVNGGGGGGGWTYGGANPSGGGGGGNGAAGSNGGAGPSGETGGTGGSAVGAAALTTACFGGGGGGGADTDENAGTDGAAGKGFVLFIAKNIDTSSATITGTGGTATNPSGSGNASGGGGGAGGSILIKTQVAILGTNKIVASGGAGGNPTGSSYATGGNGAVGRIRCDYFTSVSGTTTPTLSSAQDTTLFTPSSNFFLFF